MKKKKREKGSLNQPTVINHEVLLFHQRLLYGCSAALALLIPVFYLPSLRYSFQFDDLASIPKYFNIRNHTFRDLFFHSPRWISYWLNSVHYKIGKFNPLGYRLFNVCLHTLTTVLIFLFLYYALSSLRKSSFFKEHALSIAFTAAGLFGIHPVQTQTVSYIIQGQLEGMAAFFMIAASLCFFLMCQTKIFSKRFFSFGFLLLFLVFIGTGSKEIFIVMPLLLLLIDWFFVAQGEWESLKERWFIHTLVFLIVFFVYLYFLKPDFFYKLFGLKLQAQNNSGNVLTQEKSEKIRPIPFMMSQFKVILHYIGMFIWPFKICVEYDWKLSKSFFSYDCIVPFIMVCGILSGVIKLLRNNNTNIFAFAALWFFIVIAPRSSIIPSSELLADYKTYGASLGIMLILASIIVWIISKLHVKIHHDSSLSEKIILTRLMVIFVMMIPLGYATINRNKVWSSGEEFWKNIIENAPGKARAYNNYAVALAEKQLYKESIPYYLKAIEMDPHYADPWNNVAVAYSMIGDLDKAIACLQKVIKMQPAYPEGYNNLASFLIQKKEYDKALEILFMALNLRKHYGKAYFNLCKVYLAKNQQEEAWKAIKNACTEADLDNDPGAFIVYGRLSMLLNKYQDCIGAYTKLLELQPNSFEHTFELANSYFLQQNYDKAFQWYQKAYKLKPGEARLMYNLGETTERLGKYQQALDYFNEARKLGSIMPQLPLRIAHCLQKLRRDPEARTILQEILKNNALPEQLKVAAQSMLSAQV